MEYPVADFLGTSLIPELSANVSAGAAGNGQLVLVVVAAVGAFPYQFAGFIFLHQDFSVETAALAVIAFGVQLCVHDIVVNKLHDA